MRRLFDWDEEPAPCNDTYGAAHAFDLAFGFGDFGPSLLSNIANSTANRPGPPCTQPGSVAASSDAPVDPGGCPGTGKARSFAFGANTPWNRIGCRPSPAPVMTVRAGPPQR
ncbi:MAG: hypothetical protein ABIO45_18740 [Burkholderiaceae bacterium]